jgi:molecular chaperone DnaK (HSP70)
MTVSRACEQLCKPLFDRMLFPVHSALEEAGLALGDVSDIVLVGGSTRIPRVRRMLGDLFGKLRPQICSP